MNRTRLLLPFLLLWLPSALVAQDLEARIVYTGKLLGYYRIPERQQGQSQCDNQTSPLSHRTQAMLDQLGLIATGQEIRVGMGSNFGPNYESRFVFPTSASPELKSRQQTPMSKFCDNVANFFVQAEYSALAVGREDFLSGAQRLMDASHWMLDPTRSHPVHVLASNLVVRTNWAKQSSAKVEPDGYLTSHPSVKGSVQQVLPWQKTFTLTLDPRITEGGILPNFAFCETADGPFTYDPTHTRPAPGAAYRSGCDSIPPGAGGRVTFKQEGGTITFSLNETLASDHSYGICIPYAQATDPAFEIADKPYCLTFTVERPFVEEPRAGISFSSLQDGERPWKLDPANRIAVFGVVDSTLRSQISHENAVWRSDGWDRVSELYSFAPEIALKQVLALFNELNKVDKPGCNDPDPEKCKQAWVGTKVLLAQMPLAKAQELADHFRCRSTSGCDTQFDVIIAEGDEDHATDRMQETFWTNVLPAQQGSAGVANARGMPHTNPALVVAPHPAAGNVSTPVSWVEIRRTADVRYRNQLQTTVDNQTAYAATEKADCLARPGIFAELEVQYHMKMQQEKHRIGFADRHSNPFDFADKRSASFDCTALEQYLLQRMRERINADVAMIQVRDVYKYLDDDLDQMPEYLPLQEELDRVFWKGDLLARVSLSGAQLKALIQASNEIAQAQDSQTQIVEVKDRKLMVFGINTVKGDLYIDGQKLDEKRQYIVATTDFVALGETGFPQLAASNGVDATVFQPPQMLSVLACDTTLADNWFVKGDCRPQPSDTVFQNPPRNQQWDDRRPRTEPSVQWAKDWRASDPFGSLKGADLVVQNRRIWHLALQDLSGSTEIYHPDISDTTLANLFGGVSDATASQVHSTNFEINQKSRLTWDGTHVDLAPFETNFAFASKRTGDSSGKPDSLSLPKNGFTVGPFVQLHFHRYLPRWKAFVLRPFDFATQVRSSLFTFPLQVASGPPLQFARFAVPLIKQKSYASKVGTRYEKDSQNYAEAGYQLKQDFDVLRQITFNPEDPANKFTCGLDPALSLVACAINNKAKLTPTSTSTQFHGTFHNPGLYWDMKGTVPLIPFNLGVTDFAQWASKISLVVDSQGDFFQNHHGDINTLTRYGINAGFGIKLPVFGNLALEPRNEWYFYENKVIGSTLQRLHFKMTLTYNFDFYSGGKFWQSARFNPAPANK